MSGKTKKEDLLFPGTGIPNIPAPDHYYLPNDVDMINSTALNMISKREVSAKDLATCFKNLGVSGKNAPKRVKVFPDEVCDVCGAKTGPDGVSLRVCSNCKKRHYCGGECQKLHWSEQKQVCKTAVDGKQSTHTERWDPWGRHTDYPSPQVDLWQHGDELNRVPYRESKLIGGFAVFLSALLWSNFI